MRSTRFPATNFSSHAVGVLQRLYSDLRHRSVNPVHQYRVPVRGCNTESRHRLPTLRSSSRLQVEAEAIHPISFVIHHPAPLLLPNRHPWEEDRSKF